MTWFRAGGGGIPASLKNGMNAVLNKKFGTSGQTYAPSDWPDDVNLLGKLPEKTASGALVNITDGADDVPIKALSCSIVPQGGNGTPSSPVPITGTSKIELTHTKKNQFDNTGFPRTISENAYYGQFQSNVSGGQWKIPEIHIVTDVQYTLSLDISCNVEPFNISVGTGTGGYNRDVLSVTGLTSGRVSITFTLSSAIAKQYGDIFTFRVPRYNASTSFEFTISNIQLEVGSSASAYEAYDADTYDIDMPVGKNLLPNKTYQRNANTLRLGTDALDGRLSLKAGTYTLSITSDVEIGTLTYTIGGTSTGIPFTSSGTRYYGSFTLSTDTDDFFVHVYKSGGITAANVSDFMLEVGSTATSYVPYKTVFGGTYEEDGSLTETLVYRKISAFTWTKQTASGRDFFIATSSIMTSSTQKTILCDMLPYGGEITVAAMADKSLASWGVTLRIYDASITDVPTLLSTYGNGAIVYPLANSTEVQIDPLPQINTHLGVNNFWTDVDGGETEVTYRADIDLALAQLSGTRSLMMASRSIAPMSGEEADLDKENELTESEEVSENSDNEESEEER